MRKGIRFRAYPNKEQEALINKTFGCCRLVYNKALAMRIEAHEKGERIGFKETSAMLTELKHTDDFSFLNEVEAVALQQSLRDLDKAYQNFFAKRAGFPHFKSKKDSHQTYRTMNGNNPPMIRIVGRCIKLPKLGYVKIKQTMPVENIKNVTVEKTPSGKYFVILNVEFVPEERTNAGGEIGLAMGIQDFYTDSNRNSIENPKHYEKAMAKLAREQRRLSRKKPGSKNREKQRIRVAKVHEKVANQRRDFLQKQSTMLIRENQTICIQDLQVKKMLQNPYLARSLASASWATFFAMLEYKAAWYGNEIRNVPASYPSAQTCSRCGHVHKQVKDLKLRKWECPVCHTIHDRGVNTSINILHQGQNL